MQCATSYRVLLTSCGPSLLRRLSVGACILPYQCRAPSHCAIQALQSVQILFHRSCTGAQLKIERQRIYIFLQLQSLIIFFGHGKAFCFFTNTHLLKETFTFLMYLSTKCNTTLSISISSVTSLCVRVLYVYCLLPLIFSLFYLHSCLDLSTSLLYAFEVS
jgi:hypothetical protein